MMAGSRAPSPAARARSGSRNPRPLVLVSESSGFSENALRALRGVADVRLEDLDRGGLIAAVAAADVLWVRLRNRIDREVLAPATSLRTVVSATTGHDHIDVQELQHRGIRLLSLRGEQDHLSDVRATAEHTIGLMLALIRALPAAHEHVLGGGWDRDLFWGSEIHGKTVGIVGFGRLGRLASGYLQAFGAQVLACDPRPATGEMPPGIEMCTMEELLGRSDIVSLHATLDESTRGLIGRTELARMRRGAWLVNTARGGLLDEDALLEALRSGELAGAALDVLADEHDGPSPPLVDYAKGHRNLLITPHIGGATRESREKTERYMAGRLVRELEQGAP